MNESIESRAHSTEYMNDGFHPERVLNGHEPSCGSERCKIVGLHEDSRDGNSEQPGRGVGQGVLQSGP